MSLSPVSPVGLATGQSLSSDALWDVFTDTVTGRRYLLRAETSEFFFTRDTEAAEAGWKLYRDPAIGGHGYWWWHDETGRYFEDPSCFKQSAPQLRAAPPVRSPRVVCGGASVSVANKSLSASAVTPAAPSHRPTRSPPTAITTVSTATPSTADVAASRPSRPPPSSNPSGKDGTISSTQTPSSPASPASAASASTPVPMPPRRAPPPAIAKQTAGASPSSCRDALKASGIDVWICLDFEWTCDEGEERRVRSDEGEIIEFAFVVYDAKAGRDICEGQYYCKPQRTPLTEFCTELTGISEETLATAGTLEDALVAFGDAMSQAGLSERRCCAVTHGPCDLELTLPRNCSANGCSIPTVLRNYVDLREAAQHYVHTEGIKDHRASTLKEICDALGVDMIGDEHCGLDDAWMVLMSLQVLLKSQADLQVINIDIEHKEFLSLECREHALAFDGMPFHASLKDVQVWLKRLVGQHVPSGNISIVLGLDGRPSGRVVVEFASRKAALDAFKVLAYDDASLSGGKLIECETSWGIAERLVLARPLRRQERACKD